MTNSENHSHLQQEDVALVKTIEEMFRTDTDNSAELMPLLQNLSMRLKEIFANVKDTKIDLSPINLDNNEKKYY